jgi:LmbE family N-acetylglucosaminyl deacetylase
MPDQAISYPSMRLICITAHPDDEAGGFGGSLLKYSDLGVKTCVICLTAGQAATHRGAAKSDQELGAIRRKEFAAACGLLKVSDGLVLDYPDGQLYRQDLYRVVCDLTLHVRRFRPQVMITFGPEGGLTGHPDHSMASIFASLAFHWAGRDNRYPDQITGGIKAHRAQKLYYATADFTLPGRQPITMPPVNAIIDIREQLETKISAFKTHPSQSPLWAMFEQNVRGRGNVEKFHLAVSLKYGAPEAETDLFSGVTQD